jgi:dihydrofolate reductase
VRIKLPSISYVVARSTPRHIIGRDNKLPWHLRTDLRRFKEITLGHVIIMGRKTLLSIGRALPGRVNIVLSRTSGKQLENSFWEKGDTSLVWVENRVSALFFADVLTISRAKDDFFVIGGSEMYRIFEDLFNKVYLTEVLMPGEVVGDALFNYRFDRRKWRLIQEEHVPAGPNDEYPSTFSVLERRRKTVRYIDVENYFTEAESKQFWLHRQLDLFKDIRQRYTDRPLEVPYQFEMFEA